MKPITDNSSLLLTLAAAVLVIVGWHSPLMFPAKMLTVFFHELSHALMTLATGGRVHSFELSPDQGGRVMSVGGHRFLTLSAGYLGSLAWGVGLFLFANRTRADRYATGGIAAIMILVAVAFSTNGFALAFCIGGAMIFGSLSIAAGHLLNDLALRIAGVACMLYVPLDIISDTLLRPGLQSDARMLAEEFVGTTVLWGGLWLLLSIAVGAWMTRQLLRRR